VTVEQLAGPPAAAEAGARAPVAAGRGARVRALVELTKPGITRMVLATTAAGFYLASARRPDWLLFGHTVAATALAASGAGAWNQYVERAADARMLRTRSRPLPAGRLSARAAAWFAAVLSFAGVAWLLATAGAVAAGVVAASLLTYVFVYTPLKLRTSWATVVGALPGALPILAGWTAAGGRLLDAAGLALFGVLFAWQMPHFYALAWIYRDDYVRGGFRMLTADDATGERTARHVVGWTVALLPLSLAPAWLGLAGRNYALAAVLLGAAYLGLGLALLAARTNRRAWLLFIASVVYLPALLLVMVLDRAA
jgi:protoheme IX farnesyltransferase